MCCLELLCCMLFFCLIFQINYLTRIIFPVFMLRPSYYNGRSLFEETLYRFFLRLSHLFCATHAYFFFFWLPGLVILKYLWWYLSVSDVSKLGSFKDQVNYKNETKNFSHRVFRHSTFVILSSITTGSAGKVYYGQYATKCIATFRITKQRFKGFSNDKIYWLQCSNIVWSKWLFWSMELYTSLLKFL